MKQKILTLLLAAFMMVTAFSMNSEAAETEKITMTEDVELEAYKAAFEAAAQAEELEVVDAGYCGNPAVMWGITPDGMLLIVSETPGTMWEMKSHEAPWDIYKEYIWAVLVQGTVKNIPSELFSGAPVLEYVYLESGVTSIGTYAFANCPYLTEVELANTVTSIGTGAFVSCKNLSYVNIPSSLKSIPDKLFSGCTSLTKMTIPGGVTQIGASAFAGCTRLASVNIPNTVNVIKESAFQGCPLTSISIPSSVTEIKTSAFSGTAIEKVVIPNSVSVLGESVFASCTKLKEVDLPDYITAIPGGLLSGCYSLKTITIPSMVTGIGVNAFANCTNLKSIRIPVGVTSIGGGAFTNCTRLGEVSVMNADTKFGSNVFKTPGSNLVIRCHENSTAHTYAVSNNHPYEFLDMSNVTDCFADVEENKWFVDSVQYVFDKDLMSGSGEYFNPTKNVTRAQLVTTLYRLAGEPEVTDTSALTDFSDVATGKYYTDAVCWAYAEGIANGSNGKFDPTGGLTRQQMAAFFFRYAGFAGLDTEIRGDFSSMLNADKVYSYAAEPVEWAVGTGLISGSDVTVNGVVAKDLNPKGYTTRAQVATILMRFCEK